MTKIIFDVVASMTEDIFKDEDDLITYSLGITK